MTTFRTAVVEDEESDYKNLLSVLERYQKETNVSFQIEHFSCGQKFIDDRTSFDIVFLDIDLKDKNGIDVARELRKRDKRALIIFVTNLAQFAINGYEVDALDFVVKPVKYYDFFFKIQKAVDRAKYNYTKPIVINSNKTIITLNQEDITYVEVRHHSIIVHTLEENINVYGTLKDFEEKLSNTMFCRCNSCYLVNLSHVTSVSGYTIKIKDEELLISHPKKKDFMKALNNFINGASL